MIRKDLFDLELSKETVDAVMELYGKSINAEKEKSAEKDKTIAELTEQIKAAPDSESFEKLKAKIKEFEEADKLRKEKEELAAKDKKLMENISAAIEGKEFINELTKDGIINQIKSELAKEENSGKGASEIFEVLTKDKENIFKNPQDGIKIPPAGNRTPPESVKAQMDAFYKSNPFYKG